MMERIIELLFNSLTNRRSRSEAIPHICDFSRGGLNTRLPARIQTAATKSTNMAYGIHWLRLLFI